MIQETPQAALFKQQMRESLRLETLNSRPVTIAGSGANLIIMDNRRHDPTPILEARTLQRPPFQSSPDHSGRTMVCHLQAELSGCVRSDSGAWCHGRAYYRYALGPMLRPRLRER